MRYNYPAIRRAVLAGRNPLTWGPWRADRWYTPSWPIWRKGGMKLEITEGRTDTQTVTTGPDYGTGPLSHESRVKTETWHFLADVSDADLWRGAPLDAPEGASYWNHASKCAFGEGLYDCEGGIYLSGTIRYTYQYATSFMPADGGEGSSNTDYFETEDTHSVAMLYSTAGATLAGRATHCRIIVDQFAAPLGAAFWDSTLWFPQPTDPDGVTGTPEHPVAERYYTDTALAALASGSWGASMVLGGGALSAASGPNLDGIDNGGMRSHSYSRSGTLSLSIV